MTLRDRFPGMTKEPSHWLVTGAAGFIGSNLVEALLRAGQTVVGLDNFSTGFRHNLDQVRDAVGPAAWSRFEFIEGDIRSLEDCRRACQGAHYVLHQAALGSVPRSIEDPITSHDSNVTGFLHMLVAARDAKVKRMVYAASSAIYGDHPGMPKVEHAFGNALSPYAANKHFNEIYAGVFGRCYGMQTVGLRYFNVFGPRQDPDGAYAAVIPKWIAALLRHQPVQIYGDGETSRDFCYVDNAVQANIAAALATHPEAVGQVYNVAVGGQTSLNELFGILVQLLSEHDPSVAGAKPQYADFRAGDVRQSRADISKARELLGYFPTHDAREGLERAIEWYVARLAPEAADSAMAAAAE
jgi:UDP-N-acetylglucosamine 4-epimerase